jgi:pimeloyl-ACP methyl ester carboxylesterase
MNKLLWYLEGAGFPEYPGANVTTLNITYASTNDPSLTALKATIVYPTGATNLPVLICGHGYHETVSDMNTADNNLTRWARLGYLVLACEGRGNNGSSGGQDDAGRETMDVYDGLQYVITNHSDKIALGRYSLLGFSGGGASSLLLATRYPDLFQSVTDFFGISDWEAWYNQEPARQASLASAIGGTPVALPDEYDSRKAVDGIAVNFMGFLSMFHDEDDASVEVSHSRNVQTAYINAGRTDYYYNESNSGSAYRWTHAYPLSSNDLNEAEALWKNRPKTTAIQTIATSGTLKILGMLVTKRFTVYMNDGSYLNSGRSRFGTLVYNTVTNSYQVTNEGANYAVVSIVTSSGLVATGVLDAGETYSFTPVTIAVDGDTPILWIDAASKKLLSGSDVSVITDRTGGPQYQGYSLTYVTNRPELLSTDINSLPAIDFLSTNSEGFSGLRRPDLQGIGAFTCIEVSTGTIIDHGAGATNQTQFAVLSGGNYFYAVSNAGAASGSDGGAATYLVRSLIFDGSQSGNAARLVRRENKAAQSVSFTGTIPATTESHASSVFGIGKRSYSATYFSGKLAEIQIFSSALADVGDKEDILKTKYGI